MIRNSKRRWLALYYSISMFVGMSGAVFGPSLLKLSQQTNANLTLISTVFPARAFSYLVGSLVAGILFDRYSGHKILVRALPLIGITLGAITYLKNPYQVILVAMLMALATGIVDVGCNSLLFRIPDLKLGSAMSGLHFFFGLGSFSAPLVIALSLKLNQTIRLGYLILALFTILILLQFIKLPHPPQLQSPVSKAAGPADTNPQNQVLMILVIGLFFFAFVGVEIGFGDWVSTYAFQSGIAGERVAVMLASVYWGAFTLSRLFSIPLAARLRPEKILMIDMAGGLAGLGLVFFFPGEPITLWVGTVLLGMSVASLFPASLTYAENFLPMTGKNTSIFFIAGSVGSIFIPWLIGRQVESAGPLIIIQVLFPTLCLAAAILVVLIWISNRPHPESAEPIS